MSLIVNKTTSLLRIISTNTAFITQGLSRKEIKTTPRMCGIKGNVVSFPYGFRAFVLRMRMLFRMIHLRDTCMFCLTSFENESL